MESKNNYNLKITDLLSQYKNQIKPANYDNIFGTFFDGKKRNKRTYDKYEYILKNMNQSKIPFSKSNINKLYKDIQKIEKVNKEAKELKEKYVDNQLEKTIKVNVTSSKEGYNVLSDDIKMQSFNEYDSELNYKIAKRIKDMAKEKNVKQIVKHYVKFFHNGKELTEFTLNFVEEKNGEVETSILNIESSNLDIFYTTKDKSSSISTDFLHKVNVRGSNFSPIIKFFLDQYKNSKVEIYYKIFNPIINNEALQYRYIQKYANNNAGTCVYDGLLKYFESKEKGKGRIIYNTLIKNEIKYKKAYDLTELNEMCINLKISITIKDLINGKDQKINIDKYNYYNISFINTRYNHLDLFLCEGIECETIDEMTYDKIKNDSSFYVEKCGTLYTLDNVYKVVDTPFKTLFKEWKDEYQINNYKIPINGDANKFIAKYDDKVHRIFSNDIINDNSLYQEIDLKKAYYNYDKKGGLLPTGSYLCISKNDKGEYLTIDEFKEQSNNNIVGWYEIEIIKGSSKLDYLGFNVGSIHVIFTPQIKVLMNHGCEFKFINYCISTGIEAPFNKDFLKYGLYLSTEKYDNEVSAYAKAVGIMMIENMNMETRIKVNDTDFNKTIFYKDNQYIYKSDNIYKLVEYNIESNSLKHIALAIHAYSSSIILDTMLNFENINNIVAVKVDSIVYKKTLLKVDEDLFKLPSNANIESLINMGGHVNKYFINNITKNEYIKGYDYGSDIIKVNIKGIDVNGLDYGVDVNDDNKIIEYNKTTFSKSFCGEHIIKSCIFLGGAGGSGKTHSILNSSNFNHKSLIFSSSCWDLIQQKCIEKPDILGLTCQKLSGNNNGQKSQKFETGNYKYIVVDEATLIDDKSLKLIINQNKNKFVIVMGDIDYDGFYYQCSISSNIFKPSKNKVQYIQYNKTYRFNEELNNKLKDLRTLMKTTRLCHAAFAENDSSIIYDYVKKEFKDNFKNKEDIKFNKDYHTGISCLKSIYDDDNICKLSKSYIKSNNINDYNIYIKTTNFNKGEFRGRIHDKKETYTNYEAGVFKTIHSFQGRELKKDTETEKYKIIINFNSLFDSNLLYTALSRARTVEQIIIIDDIKTYNNQNDNAGFLD